MHEDEVDWDGLESGAMRLSGEVAYRAFGEQAVLLHIGSGAYHELNEVGRRVYEALSAGESLEAAVQSIAGDYDVPAERVRDDVLGFCRQLASQGLLQRA